MKKLSLILLGVTLFTVSCKKDDPTPTSSGPVQPKTYSFDNVSYSGQTTRLDMLGELTNEMKKPASGTAADS